MRPARRRFNYFVCADTIKGRFRRSARSATPVIVFLLSTASSDRPHWPVALSRNLTTYRSTRNEQNGTRDQWLLHRFNAVVTKRSRHSQECKNPRRHRFVPCDLDFDFWPLTFDPKMNGFSGLMVEHFCIKLQRFHRFWDIMRKNRQTDAQKNKRLWISYRCDYRRRRWLAYTSVKLGPAFNIWHLAFQKLTRDINITK